MNITTSKKRVGRAPEHDVPVTMPPNPVPLPDVGESREITLKLPSDLISEIEAWAEAAGRSVDEQMRLLLQRGLGVR